MPCVRDLPVTGQLVTLSLVESILLVDIVQVPGRAQDVGCLIEPHHIGILIIPGEDHFTIMLRVRWSVIILHNTEGKPAVSDSQ